MFPPLFCARVYLVSSTSVEAWIRRLNLSLQLLIPALGVDYWRVSFFHMNPSTLTLEIRGGDLLTRCSTIGYSFKIYGGI